MSRPIVTRTTLGPPAQDGPPVTARGLPAALGGLRTGSIGLSVRPAGTPAQVEELRLLLARIPGVQSVRLVAGDRHAAELRVDVGRPIPLASEVRRTLGRLMRSCTKDGDHLHVRLAAPVPLTGTGIPHAGPSPLTRRWDPRADVAPPSLPPLVAPARAPARPAATEPGATAWDDGSGPAAVAPAPATPAASTPAATARPGGLAPGAPRPSDPHADDPLVLAHAVEDVPIAGGYDALAEHEALIDLAAVFEASFSRSFSGEGLLTVDGDWLRANATLEHLLGRTETDLRGTTIAALVPGDDAEREARLRGAALRGEHDGYELELRMRTANGRLLPVIARMTTVRVDGDARGLVLHVVAAASWTVPPSGAVREIRARRG